MIPETRTIQQSIAVSWEFPVTFTHGLFDVQNPVLVQTLGRLHEHRRARALVFVDGHVAAARPNLVAEIAAYFSAHTAALELAGEVVVVPGGEAVKNDFSLVEGFMRLMLERHIDRQSFVVIVGGGAVMDAVGHRAASVDDFWQRVEKEGLRDVWKERNAPFGNPDPL